MNVVLIRVCCYVIGLLLIGAAVPPSVAFAQPDEHRTGYQPDDPEVPGTVAHVPRFRAFLPPFKDLSASFPPPGDQGRQDSCVAWSLGYALRGYYYRQRMQSRTNDPSSLLSPAFIYNQVVRNSDCSGGSKLKDALDIMRSEGIATMADFPYDDRSCVRKPNDDIMRRAAVNMIAAYRSFGRPGEIKPDDVKGSLMAGTPIAIGMNIDAKRLTRLKRGEIYDQDGPASFSGHAMVVTGFDDRLQAFKIINSWGTRWADGGFGWISYRAFTANVRTAIVIEDNAGPTPPAPEPTPIPAPLPVPSPGMDMAAVTRLLDDEAKAFVCSRLLMRSTNATEGSLRGWVASQADMDVLNGVLGKLPSGIHIAQEVRLRPWPQCEALMTLSDGVNSDHGMAMSMVDHDGTEYEAGTRLIMQVKTPDFPSYLYVTYLPANGDAVLLYKPRGVVPTALPAGTTVDLGGGDDPRIFRIGPPFGAEMVIAVATASPLFTDAIPVSATERDYLTALRKTLLYKPDPNQPDRVVDARALALTTREATQGRAPGSP